MCFPPQGPNFKSSSSQKSNSLSYLYSLLQSSILSSSGKNPDSESWKLKSLVSSLNHGRRQTETLALEKCRFHFSHFTVSHNMLRMSVSSTAKLYVSFSYSINKFTLFFFCFCSADKNRSYSLFVSCRCINFIGSVTFLKQKARRGSTKEKVQIPSARLLSWKSCAEILL